MEGTLIHAVIMEDWKLHGDKSWVAKADEICDYYGFAKVSKVRLDKIQIKHVIRLRHDTDVWRDSCASSIVVQRPYLRLRSKMHMRWSKSKARALLAYRTGALKFKSCWKLYNVKRGVGVKCVMPLCDGDDSLEHVKMCRWYDTKWSDDYTTEDEIADYIIRISRERLVKLRMPLI